jgi:AbiV family abortive infection protein
MASQVDRALIFEGMCHALAHAAHVVEDAAILYASKRVSSSFHLAVMAREELGRCNLLWKHHEQLSSSQTIDAEQLAKSLSSHTEKLRAGQRLAPVSIPLETWAKLEQALRRGDMVAVNEVTTSIDSRQQSFLKRQPNDLHMRRLTAQYVDLDTLQGRWTTPSEVTREEAATLIQTVMTEISLLLLAGQANALPRRPFERANVSLPDGFPFVQRVLDLLNRGNA